MNFDYKRVNDPVHGSIHLSEMECDIISTGVFQRLHNVKQLGLGVVVYPGANYSRFSHSLGACHLAGRMIDAIARNSDKKINKRTKQLYRLGGLLHDIGHYPFSHSFEHSLEKHYGGSGFFRQGSERVLHYDHEVMGKEIIRNDPEILAVLKKHRYSFGAVIGVFSNKKIEGYRAILSSDLDCDRLDYLMRTAHHAGLPFGRIDLNHIINNTTIDEDGNVCINHKALRSADHLLLSRFYDYAQLPFHKKVASMELSLQKVVEYMLLKGELHCSQSDMLKQIKNGEWKRFDDQRLISKIRKLKNVPLNIQSHIIAILERKPATMVFSREEILKSGAVKTFMSVKDILLEKKNSWVDEFGIPAENWHICDNENNPFKFTKYGNENLEGGTEISDETFELVLIKGLNSKNKEKSKPLIACNNTVISPLSSKRYVYARLFVFIPEGRKNEKQQIKDKIRLDMMEE